MTKRYVRTGVQCLVATAAAVAAAQPAAFPDTDLDPDVPAPAGVIGHEIGAAAVRYDALVRYLHALDDASDLVTLTPYAETHEGRRLHYLTITSLDNHAKLDAIRTDNARLADPRTLDDPSDAAAIIETLPAVAWMSYAIHGDELSSTDAALQVAYRLAAGTDAATRRLRDELVIHIDPLQNPDGRERYLAQLQTLQGKVPNPDYQAMQHAGLWSAGRGNHYLFDLNRDWLPQVHPETRGRAAVIRSWNPHLVVDSHEMGSLDTYLFDPPREPLNIHLSAQNKRWRGVFSADQAAAFDRHGWSYYTREWYEEWYPGYTNAWGNLRGAIGILYEQAGVNGAAVTQRSGEILTYRQSIAHHVVSSLANLESLRANRVAILRDFAADRRWAVSAVGPFNETLLLPPGGDPSRRARFIDLLERQGIESSVAAGPIEATDVIDAWGRRSDTATFPAGTLVVASAQPMRRLMHAILGFDPHMSDAFLEQERTDLERRRGSRIYDVTGWSIPLAYGLDAAWARHTVEADPGVAAAPPDPVAAPDSEDAYGFVIDGRSADVHRALVMLFEHDCRPRIASKPFTAGGVEYRPGSVLLRGHENPATLGGIVAEIDDALDIEVRPVRSALAEGGPDLGGRRFDLLQPPRVAIASQWPVATTSFGSTWYLLDARLGLRTSPVNVQRLRAIDLRAYNVLVLPAAWNGSLLGGVLDEDAVKRIRVWVEAGGTLIAIGGSAAFVSDEDRGLSAVRSRRNVLDELDVYDEALARERDAREITVDPARVWGPPRSMAPAAPGPPQDPDAAGDEAKPPPRPDDDDALKRADAWARIFSPQGVIASARLDPEHWLCFGLGDRLPVLLRGSFAYMSRHPVATPARFDDADQLRLSGLLWPEARQRWAGTAYATVERRGNGQVILFAADPFFRGYFEGSGRLLSNAILLGPGMGTSQPVPW